MTAEKLFQGNLIEWQGKGVYTLSPENKKRGWSRTWFKLDQMILVEDAARCGRQIVYIEEADLAVNE